MIKYVVIFSLLIIGIIILFAVLGYISKSGEAAGMVGGKLLKCSAKPNCVCSEYNDDINHYIKPIIIPQNINCDFMNILKETIQEMGGEIQTELRTYIAATFSSSVFGFVDDLEIRYYSTQNVIHLRSASRIGYSDLGANKKRAKLLKDLFYKKLKND